MRQAILLIVSFIFLFFHAHCEENKLIKKTHLYFPDSNRIAITYSWLEDKIILRQAFAYTSCGTIGIVSTDDGSDKDINSLKGATYRKILYMTPDVNFPIGIPAKLEERVLDLETKKEILVKATYHTFSREGWLIKQEVFDSDYQLASLREWEYDDKGYMVRQINTVGDEIFWGYDSKGNRNYEKGPRQDKHKGIFFDHLNRVIREDEVHENGTLSTYYRYDTAGRKICKVDPYGQETNFVYDAPGNLTQIICPPIEGDNGQTNRPITMFTYFQGLPSSHVDPQGNVIKFQFFSKDHPSKIIYPDGSEELYEYSLNGEICKIADKTGATKVLRDYQGRILQLENFSPTGTPLWTATAKYDSLHMTSETDALGITTEYFYDVLDRKIKQVRGQTTIVFENDARGRVSKEIHQTQDGECLAYAFTYDPLDRMIEEKEEDGFGKVISIKKYAYDENGRKTQIIAYGDNGPEISQTLYDSHNMKRVTDPYGNVTAERIQLDQPFRSTETIDPLGRTTTVVLDGCGRPNEITKRNAEGLLTQKNELTYDLLGNVKKDKKTVVLPTGKNKEITTAYDYDNMQRCVAKIEFAGSKHEKKTTYQHGTYGLLSVVKPSGIKLFYNYTPDGLLATCVSSDSSIHYNYTYDHLNRLIAVRDEIQKTEHAFTYNSLNQLEQETFPNSLVLKFEYTLSGKVKAKILPDQSKILYTYDCGLLKTVEKVSPSGELLFTHTYSSYDLGKRPTSELLFGRAGTVVKTYDKLGELASVTSLVFKETIPEQGWDPLRNVVKKKIKDAKGELEVLYTYNTFGQIVNEKQDSVHSYLYYSMDDLIAKDKQNFTYNDQNQIIQAGKQILSYNEDGGLSNNKEERFFYDALGRLIAIKSGKFEVFYTYDAFNRRLTKKVCSFNTQKECAYLYDGEKEIGCYQNGEPIESCIYGLNDIVAIQLKDKIYASIVDCSHDVVALVTPTGHLVEGYRYTSFGDETVFDSKGKSKQPINPWRFSSNRFDKETGLYCISSRYYCPKFGKFITQEFAEKAYFEPAAQVGVGCAVSTFSPKKPNVIWNCP